MVEKKKKVGEIVKDLVTKESDARRGGFRTGIKVRVRRPGRGRRG